MPTSVSSAAFAAQTFSVHIQSKKPRYATKMNTHPATVFSFLSAPLVVLAHVLQSWSRRLSGDSNGSLVVLLAGIVVVFVACPIKSIGATVVNYSPDQIGSVSAPVEGLGATSSDYLLTGVGGTAELEKNFTTNGEDSFSFPNPSNAQDAASFDDNYMFQLGTDNGLRKVSLFDGSQVQFNSLNSLNIGANSFGIGYDANANSIGIGLFDNGTMTFKEYDLGTNTLNTLASFAFDTSAYGTPTGLDFKNNRMIVGTRDQKDNKFAPELNFILDMNANTGLIDQYATIAGSTNKLQDVLYDDGRLAAGYQRSGTGYMTVGDFNIVPEPSQYAALAGALALGLAATARRKKDSVIDKIINR